MLISINRSSEQKAMVTVMRVDAKKTVFLQDSIKHRWQSSKYIYLTKKTSYTLYTHIYNFP